MRVLSKGHTGEGPGRGKGLLLSIGADGDVIEELNLCVILWAVVI